MDDYENESLPVGEAQVAEAMQTLQRYKAGKAALDKRIVEIGRASCRERV